MHIADQSSFAWRKAKRNYSISLKVVSLAAAGSDVIGLCCAGFVANLSYTLFLTGKINLLAGSPAIGLVGR